MDAVKHEPGAVEILCKEIGFRYERGMETPAMLVAFTRVLVGEVEEMREWMGHTTKLTGKAPSVESGNVLARVKTMLDAPDTKALLISAAAAHDYIHSVHSDEDYPTDHFIDMLSSCVSAVRFGLEMPCHSRHAASAAQHIWRLRYGVTLHDSFNSAWENDWARAMLTRAILLQAAQAKALHDALRNLVFQARTSGGTAGRDDALCAACDKAESLLSIITTPN